MDATADIESWIPDLSAEPLEDLLRLNLAVAEQEMLARVDQPLATVAGSNGS